MIETCFWRHKSFVKRQKKNYDILQTDKIALFFNSSNNSPVLSRKKDYIEIKKNLEIALLSSIKNKTRS